MSSALGQSRLSATLERESVTQWRKRKKEKEKKKAEYRSVNSRGDRRLKEILTRAPVHPFRLVTPKNIKRAIHRDSIKHSRTPSPANPFADYPFLITFDHVREESFYSPLFQFSTNLHPPPLSLSLSLTFTFQFHFINFNNRCFLSVSIITHLDFEKLVSTSSRGEEHASSRN